MSDDYIERLRAKVEELDGMWRAASKGSASQDNAYRAELDRHIALNAKLLIERSSASKGTADLVAALERIADLASSDDWSSAILSIANAAIAKAKGEMT